MKNIIYFDVETQKTAEEVGGWSHIDRMKLAVAVTYSTKADEYASYLEKNVEDLIAQLKTADLVVGFNVKRFDYTVLTSYTSVSLQQLPTVDMLYDIHRTLGFRISLDALASATLGAKKSADGLQAVRWYKNGDIDKVIEYCKKDVEITKQLHEYGCANGFVWFTNRRGAKQRAPVSWKL